jgi:hypothetical protein
VPDAPHSQRAAPVENRPRGVDYFVPLEKVHFPPYLLDDVTVTSHAVHFAAKLGRAWWSVNTMTHYVDRPPTLEQLSVLMGVSLATTKRAARELQAKEYLVISKCGRGHAPTYQFRAPKLTLGLAFADAKALVSARSHAARWEGLDVSPVTPQTGLDVSPVTPQTGLDVSPVTPQDLRPKKERAGGRAASLRSKHNNDDEETRVVVDGLKSEGVTADQADDLLRGRTVAEVRDWIAALPDFVRENGPFKKNAAAVLMSALGGREPWPLPKAFLARRAQLELSALNDLDRRAEIAAPIEDQRTPQERRAIAHAAMPDFIRRKVEA